MSNHDPNQTEMTESLKGTIHLKFKTVVKSPITIYASSGEESPEQLQESKTSNIINPTKPSSKPIRAI